MKKFLPNQREIFLITAKRKILHPSLIKKIPTWSDEENFFLTKLEKFLITAKRKILSP